MGVLESACGNIKAALELFKRAEAIRIPIGEEVILPLGVTHMITGRALFLQQQYTAALSRYSLAEEIFVRATGPRGHFMAQ
jgi:hypothetical protein